MEKENNETSKIKDLENFKKDMTGKPLTTNQGLKVNDTNNSLKSGERGSTLLEDFLLREKITSFDHERIPERIVHARGSAPHGYFELYESIEEYSELISTNTDALNDAYGLFTESGYNGSADDFSNLLGLKKKDQSQPTELSSTDTELRN